MLFFSSLLKCFPMAPTPPQTCPFRWGICTPSNTWFLEPTRVFIPNGILISTAIFAQPLYPSKNCSFPLGICTPSNTWFLGPIWVSTPNGIVIGQALFAQLMNITKSHTDTHTDLQTNRPHYSMWSNRPVSLANAAMWPNNTNQLTTIIIIPWN